MKKIGILGGTFDPIHYGHLMLAEHAMDEFSLDEIWFIPTGNPYMKKNHSISSALDRKLIVEKAIQNRTDNFKCNDIEIKRQGNTYTYQTIQYLNETFADCHFYFIMGADCLFDISSWRNPELIFEGCSVIAAMRNDADVKNIEKTCDELRQKYNADIYFMPFIRMELSSTDIRKRVSQGKSIKYMVPDEVLLYIKEKGLYTNENS